MNLEDDQLYCYSGRDIKAALKAREDAVWRSVCERLKTGELAILPLREMEAIARGELSGKEVHFLSKVKP